MSGEPLEGDIYAECDPIETGMTQDGKFPIYTPGPPRYYIRNNGRWEEIAMQQYEERYGELYRIRYNPVAEPEPTKQSPMEFLWQVLRNIFIIICVLVVLGIFCAMLLLAWEVATGPGVA